MKKIFALVALTFLIAAFCSAEILFVPHMYGGFGFGTTVDSDSMLDGQKQKLADSWLAGMGAELLIPVGDSFALQSGLNFFINNYAVDDDVEGQLRYYTVDVPLLLVLNIKKINVSIGPYASIPIGNLKGSKSFDNVDINSDTKINFGFIGGFSYEHTYGIGRCIIGARYITDFIPVKDDDDNAIFTRRGLLLDLGYKVPLSF